MPGANHYNDKDDTSQFSESDWVAGLTALNKAVIAKCYDRYAPALYGYILKTVKEEEAASSILSAAFLQIITGITGFVPGDVRFFTWMLRITHLEMVRQIQDKDDYTALLGTGS